ncbi:MAG: HEAT repeat domain-containing protein [Planctomycetes bacterium]|nr:HEAT repeat domain-containing protein [Planctomycetota bacterium]
MTMPLRRRTLLALLVAVVLGASAIVLYRSPGFEEQEVTQDPGNDPAARPEANSSAPPLDAAHSGPDPRSPDDPAFAGGRGNGPQDEPFVKVAGAGDYEFERNIVLGTYASPLWKDPLQLEQAIAFLNHPDPPADRAEYVRLSGATRTFLRALAPTPENAKLLLDLVERGTYWRDDAGTELGGMLWCPHRRMDRKTIDDIMARLMDLSRTSDDFAGLEGVARAFGQLGTLTLEASSDFDIAQTKANLSRYPVISTLTGMIARLDAIYEEYLKNPSPPSREPSWNSLGSARSYAWQALAHYGTPESVDMLIELAESESPETRERALDGLGQSWSPEAANYLAERLARAEEAGERLQTAEALAAMDDVRGPEAITRWIGENQPAEENAETHRQYAVFLAYENYRAGIDALFALHDAGHLDGFSLDSELSILTKIESRIDPKEARDRKKVARAVELWRDWWGRNRETYQFPHRGGKVRPWR